jgi:cation diffusion facilitator CzcD-associated flavoprotein CzcO
MIGNGSTGVQILPQLAVKSGTEVFSFQRSANWVYSHITPGRLLGKTDPSPNPLYTEEEKKRFLEEPGEHKRYRRLLIHNINRGFRQVRVISCLLCTKPRSHSDASDYQFVKDSPKNHEMTELATRQMAQKLKQDDQLCEALIPKWPLGCRRITPADGYLEAFLQPNTHLITRPIKRITEDSICTVDGKSYPIDVCQF